MLPAVIGDAGTMLVYADDGCIDHLNRRVVNGIEPIHDPVPDASPPPLDGAGQPRCPMTLPGFDGEIAKLEQANANEPGKAQAEQAAE